MTNEQKAGAWDGLKDAMIDIKSDLGKSSECRQMAGQFMEIIQQIEEKVGAASAGQLQTSVDDEEREEGSLSHEER